MATKDWNYTESGTAIYLPDGEPRQKLKVTGTRFASILNLNEWSTPFLSWCEITKTAKLPFEDNMYLQAGRAIEPKVIEYLKRTVSPNVKGPEEYFGNLYSSLKYDFFPENKIFGGMWDAVITNRNGDNIRTIIEIKTTKRAEDWVNGAPDYYLAQACLYAYLTGAKQIIMSVTILKDEDYAHPENFVVDETNTKTILYNLDTVNIAGYSFEQLISMATMWYEHHVKGAVSPEFDEKLDAEILKILRTAKPQNDTSLDGIINTLAFKEAELARIYAEYNVKELEDEIDSLKKAVKEYLTEQMGDLPKIEYRNWSLTKTDGRRTADVKALMKDGLEDYIKIGNPVLTLRRISS
jgi:hypothetical protein